LEKWITDHGLSVFQAWAIVHICLILLMILLSWISHSVTRKILLAVLYEAIKRSKARWDDALVERRFFRTLAHLAPALVIYVLAPVALYGLESTTAVVQTGSILYMIVMGLLAVNSLFNAVLDIYDHYEISRRVPLKGLIQVAKIVVFCIGAIVLISIIVEKSPLVLLSGLGAATAILILIFRDAILGFVAGIQLTINDMVAVGDWIEMPKYGADGDVIDVALTTVKVRNWDKTITTIPTYALISDSFINWRGMQESGGRRIKRAIYLDMQSVTFCTEEMLERFSKIHYLSDYIRDKKKELEEYNEEHGFDDSVLVNGRRMTNLGTFRAYIVNYLKNHPMIHQDMTFLIRHLDPTERGIPIEVYVFCKDQRWAHYESIQADIFDHILAVVPFFDLRVFQSPSGADVRSLAASPLRVSPSPPEDKRD